MSSVGTPQSAIAVGFSFPIIDGILVALRFYARQQLKVERGVDDWLCIPAWLCLTGCCASMLTGIFKGAFNDAPPSDPDHVTEQEHILAQVTAALVIFWMGANFLIKLIMLFFYRRIFTVTGRAFNICNWILIGLSIFWFVYAVASWLFYCGTNFRANFEGGWKACAPWGFEIQMGVFALDSFIDFCLLVMPIPFIWRIQLDWKRKLALIVVFLLGGFAFVAGLNNTIIQLVELTNPALANSGGEANFFQGSSLLFSNWPAIEIGVGLLASNLPPLSFRIARVLKEALPRALRVSINSLRNAAAAISLSSLRGSHGHNSTRHSNEERQEGRPGSIQELWPDHASTRFDAPSRTKSLEQSSAQSENNVELPEVKMGRTGEDAV
ncbi:hypothetical protein K469DRAFT_708651 [Zopfia rhizophila CBS 207.26]|uniref:Rhodopsin domain-containing protein n=1 Tax=Zopfia rhizophila CBS 207.26 TaxID=1314779 RepID=A0A6A6E308_9PEZI|nr:hypothetical protein K469DRAFT_708651 [Zopfia rhizophila CBS 207.26]